MSEQEKFCLKWNDFERNISHSFKDLRDDRDFFDVTLACESNQIQAGLEKTRFKKSGFFGVFWFLYIYIWLEERVFRVFSVSRILLGASRLKIIITHTR
jgi:hypothetical protein